MSVEISAFVSVNVECVVMLASSTANGDLEMQFSFRGHKPFFLNPCGFSFNSVSNSKFLQHLPPQSAIRLYLLSKALILPRCLHTYIYPTFINEPIFNPGSLEQSKLLWDILRIYSLSTCCTAVLVLLTLNQVIARWKNL